MGSLARLLAAVCVAVLLLATAKCDVQSFKQHMEAEKQMKLMMDPSANYSKEDMHVTKSDNVLVLYSQETSFRCYMYLLTNALCCDVEYFKHEADITYVMPEFYEKFGHEEERFKRLTSTTAAKWENGIVPYAMAESYSGTPKSSNFILSKGVLTAVSTYTFHKCCHASVTIIIFLP